ncbi:hypothetical protein GCM10010503_23020 [Streptomyces lucensis JCM 4490]|uniref:Secreted protein n=1 Tax=Streptomyces lucensis JCM 4490 TaxID=1306176 RepID=A0A918MQ03_9ACTN|nr:DUF6479 family protein [Streptomyces lucensis]GGW45843.1 hypothetical protein GCM10010503_23020 [Streptomyces lucensis JCM 4490]
MDTARYEAASGVQTFGYVVILVAGVACVAGLIWAFRLGSKVRRRESPPPRPEEQPRVPPSGPVREVREVREPDEVPRAADGERLTPHQLGNVGTKRADDQSRPRWSPGSSGSFGGGGGGRT